MHLVGVLCADRLSAAGGWATIHRRGTTTPATTYTTFAAGGASAPATHSLDASYGTAVRYVNELVDVTVYNSSGVKVFGPATDGANATAVEIIHAHVTGTDYSTGASGLSKPSTLQLQLDRRFTSFGADDFQVLVGGVARNLKDVLLTGFIDVKGPTYGALGNGVADDTTPIQAAITAADAAGGGVVLLPPGTYIVTSLTIPSNVSLLGAGSGKTILQTSSASEVLLVAAGAFTAYGIKFKTTGKGLLRFTVADTGATTAFTACAFSCTSAATVNVIEGYLSGATTNLLAFLGCDFVQTGTGGTVDFLSNGCRVYGGKATFVSGQLIGGDFVALHDMYIEYGGAVAGSLRTPSGALLGGGIMVIAGCAFVCTGVGNLVINGSGVYETGSRFDTSGGGAVSFGTTQFRFSAQRECTTVYDTSNGATYAPDPSKYSEFFVTSNGAAFGWANPVATFAAFSGMRLHLWYKNTNGGAVTPTLGTSYKGTAVSVASGSACGWLFVWQASLAKFVQVGDVVAYAA